MLRALPAPARDAALLVARVLIGVVLVAHGVQKYFGFGLGGVAASFAKMGIPAAPVSAFYAATVELVGGVLLIAGAFTAVVGVLVVLDMLGATLLVHIANGPFAQNGGWELTVAILAGALALAALGAGRYSVDAALGVRRSTPARV